MAVIRVGHLFFYVVVEGGGGQKMGLPGKYWVATSRKVCLTFLFSLSFFSFFVFLSFFFVVLFSLPSPFFHFLTILHYQT